MNALEPGSLLTCIQADAMPSGARAVVGQTYTCVAVSDALFFNCALHGSSCGATGILLAEVEADAGWWWCSACFKPAGSRFDWTAWLATPAPADPERVNRLDRREPTAEPTAARRGH